MKYAPAVKWSGSKRPIAKEVISHFPCEIDTYYEPFCGGASVLRRLLETPQVSVTHFVCSDINDGLINLWKEIKADPLALGSNYRAMWEELNKNDDLERKKMFFSLIRDRFNDGSKTGLVNAARFLFIMRTCTNGMPRYNSKGEFNNTFHVTRNGIRPDEMQRILNEWSRLLNERGVRFELRSYDTIAPTENDVMFLDPPYAATKGMYYGGFDADRFFRWLSSVRCPYALTYDGMAGNINLTTEIPRHLYDSHAYINSGNSSFRRVVGKNRHAEVYESLYLKGLT